MTDARPAFMLPVEVGGLSVSNLRLALAESGVLLNAAADLLLTNPVFNHQTRDSFPVVQRTVGRLGFQDGAALSDILTRAQSLGLLLCPSITGPYLRLAMTSQDQAPDSIMSNGSAPSGSLTVTSMPLSTDDEYPKGFYLRVVEGMPWLRGYYTDDSHLWDPRDNFAFRGRDGQGPTC